MANKQIEAMIFAAGYGTRLAPITNTTPKPLVEINNISLIERIILQLRDANITEILINVSYLKEQIVSKLGQGEQYGVNITFQIEEPEPKETAGAILYAIESGTIPLNGNIITVNSDIYTDFNFSVLKNQEVKNGHLILVKNPEHNPNGDFSLTQNKLGLYEKKYTYSGIGIYNKSFIKNNASCVRLGDLIRKSLHNDYISGEIYNGIWHDVGTLKKLRELQKRFKIT